jgi:hypothetical protein
MKKSDEHRKMEKKDLTERWKTEMKKKDEKERWKKRRKRVTKNFDEKT